MPSPRNCGRRRRKSRCIPVRISRRPSERRRWGLTGAAELGRTTELGSPCLPRFARLGPCHRLEREESTGCASVILPPPPPSSFRPRHRAAAPSALPDRGSVIRRGERDESVVPIRGYFPRDEGRVSVPLWNEGDSGETGRGQIPRGINRTARRRSPGFNPRGSDPG
jgi:hypothetical protein